MSPSLTDLIPVSLFPTPDKDTFVLSGTFMFFHSLQKYKLVCLMCPPSPLPPCFNHIWLYTVHTCFVDIIVYFRDYSLLLHIPGSFGLIAG